MLFLKIARVIRDIHEGFVCAVINNGETSDWFKMKSGVKQGCVMSGLFLPVVDWVMRTTRAGMQTDARRDTVELHDSV